MNRFIISLAATGMMILQANAQQTIVLQPGGEGKDAMLWSTHPDNNHGHSTKFDAMAWTFYGEPGTKRSIIDFDLSLIPEGALMEKALLDLYFFTDEPTYVPHSGDNSAFIRSITSYWREEEVTWNNPPATTYENQLYLSPSTYPEQDYTNLDVTTLIKQQFDNPEEYFGLMLELETEIYYRSLMFASSDNLDSTLWPKLVVTYCFPPACTFDYETDSLEVIFIDKSMPANSWYWDFGDGYFSNLQHPVHEYASYGNYVVGLTITDECGSSFASDTIILTVAGATEEEQKKIQVYPNPASDRVNIQIPSPGDYRISLFHSLGKEILKENRTAGPGELLTLDVSRFSPGIYLLVIEYGRDRFSTKLIISG